MEINEKAPNMHGYDCYEFVFRDNGIGMAGSFRKSCLSRSGVRKIQGLARGLGMTIARNISRRMNGDIAVESEIGKGTKFVVTLILKLVDTEAPDTEKLMDLTVLVVDDDKMPVR